MEAIVLTALEKALRAAEDYLKRAEARRSKNAAACVEFLSAAQSSIEGLEAEVDEILVEAKLTARFDWERRPALFQRIDLYLNRDRLRNTLTRATAGVEACLRFLEAQGPGFFNRQQKAEVTAEVRRLLADLKRYLEELGSVMGYSPGNFASSGIQVAELLTILDLLQRPADEPGIRDEVFRVAGDAQQRRQRVGLALTSRATSTIQELTVLFEMGGT
jgi:hypothetical protein